MIDSALEVSVQPTTMPTETNGLLNNMITTLRKNIIYDDNMHIEVRRDSVLSDAMMEAHKRNFDPHKNIKVSDDFKLHACTNYLLTIPCRYCLLVKVQLMLVQSESFFASLLQHFISLEMMVKQNSWQTI